MEESLNVWSQKMIILLLLNIYISHGKADVNLGLLSDHVLQVGDMLYEYLTLLFNGMVRHGCSPSDMNVGRYPSQRIRGLMHLNQIILGVFACSLFCVICWISSI